MRAEVKVATLLVQHNIPLALADELTPLSRDVFPDSQIAKSYSSKRTKTVHYQWCYCTFFSSVLIDC